MSQPAAPDDARKLLTFWKEAGPEKWFAGGDAFDEVCSQFETIWETAREGHCDNWAGTAEGALALIILIDQIPRNLFRESPRQFSTDAKAMDVAREAIARGFDAEFEFPLKSFFYVPFMHSEDLADQRYCCDLFRPTSAKENYVFALIHMDAIARFGRFPHRNKILGRETTQDEKRYLETGGFGA